MTAQNTLTALSGELTGIKDVALKIKPDVLAGGVSYQFKLTVTNIGGIEASNVYSFRANSIPSKGVYDYFIREDNYYKYLVY